MYKNMLRGVKQFQTRRVRVRGRVVAANPGSRGQGTIK
jgi:hypothetical protein